ncbi:hypothetical protein RLDS_20405 [Sphingobium lactosutens DS20]|uniref:Uncharacterized protein n=1 Tax=Sphingobium lactosutens DS20 TaxID=1331060 RepID=T0IS44_9SPHN|nr:hypothetical protein RLDS_20405 [Sphingobium lactosutens DS20]
MIIYAANRLLLQFALNASPDAMAVRGFCLAHSLSLSDGHVSVFLDFADFSPG